MGSTVLANLGPEAVDSTDVCTAENKRELLILTYFINKCVNQSLLTHRGATHERFDWSVLPYGHQGGGGTTGEMSMLLLEEKKL